MIDLAVRSSEPEWMDVEEVDAAEFGRCLGDLAAVNIVTLARRPTLRWLSRATQGMSSFSLLDVGFGHGDMLRVIARWAARRGLAAELSGIDLNPSSEIAARAATPPEMAIDYRTGDVLAWEPERRPDFVVTALMTHHLTDDQVVALLRWMDRVAVRGWFNSDLHRHVIAYYGFRVMAAIAQWHRMVRHDGAVSIAKSFRRADWEQLTAAAGVDAEIRWMIPFKYCVSRIK
jgi:2-polyprenyl-3-methyl-5-hydroxy-6-metoxy-1,4-benzoquinol methylase